MEKIVLAIKWCMANWEMIIAGFGVITTGWSQVRKGKYKAAAKLMVDYAGHKIKKAVEAAGDPVEGAKIQAQEFEQLKKAQIATGTRAILKPLRHAVENKSGPAIDISVEDVMSGKPKVGARIGWRF